MAQTNINIRIDEEVKRQFNKICDKLGMTMSTAINIFAKTMIREQGIPFNVSLNAYNKETLKVIEDIENGKDLYGPFDTVEEAMRSMLED